MKRTMRFKAVLLAATILLMAMHGREASAAASATDEHFSVREYNIFHDVLHPLQHEALPKRDFKTIRARAAELVKKGRAIVTLGVPAGVRETEEFQKELKSFDAALTKFEGDAENAPDARLEESYNAVHDSFEMLASMLPRK